MQIFLIHVFHCAVPSDKKWWRFIHKHHTNLQIYILTLSLPAATLSSADNSLDPDQE